MAITLRTNKGIALTYNEMDKNYSSYFFSASKVGTGTLRLYYTGSTDLGAGFGPDRYIDINLNSGSGNTQLAPAGGLGAVQFNLDGTNLGGSSSDFFYNSASVQLGFNTSNPSASIHISYKDSSTPSTLRLEGQAGGSNGKQAFIEYFRGGLYGTIGLSTDSTDVYQNTIAGNRFQISGSDRVHITGSGVGIYPDSINYAVPNKTLTVVGSVGIGNTTSTTNQSVIKQLESEVDANAVPVTGGNALLISAQQNKGSVIVGLTTDSNYSESFAVVRGGIGTTYTSRVATIRANGDTNLSGSLTVRNIALTAASSGSAVIATSTGLLQKIDAAPVPKGGIIMWSGAIVDIPTGWALCNGSNGTPDLRDKFVVGAGNTYTSGSTGGTVDAVVVSHTHTGTVDTTSITGTVTYVSETFNNHGTTTGVFSKNTGYSAGGTPQTVDSSNAGRLSLDASHNHTFTTDTTGESGTNKNLPPYLALAYIMYKGI